jgi:hypothetical protein
MAEAKPADTSAGYDASLACFALNFGDGVKGAGEVIAALDRGAEA